MTSARQSAAMKASGNRERWYAGPNAISNAIKYAKFRSRSHDAVIRVYDRAGNLIGTHGLETLSSPVGCLFSQAGWLPKDQSVNVMLKDKMNGIAWAGVHIFALAAWRTNPKGRL